MTRSDFVQSLKIQTSDAAVYGTVSNLIKAPGRKPRDRDVALAKWYAGLPENDRSFLRIALQEAAELAVFNVLCVLDGVSTIEDGPDKGELKLQYLGKEQSLLLNDANQELLHDIFNLFCREQEPYLHLPEEHNMYAVGSVKDLKMKQTVSDGLDLHVVESGKCSQPDEPAIALPKNEHRKVQ